MAFNEISLSAARTPNGSLQRGRLNTKKGAQTWRERERKKLFSESESDSTFIDPDRKMRFPVPRFMPRFGPLHVAATELRRKGNLGEHRADIRFYENDDDDVDPFFRFPFIANARRSRSASSIHPTDPAAFLIRATPAGKYRRTH